MIGDALNIELKSKKKKKKKKNIKRWNKNWIEEDKNS